jgi:hypothetical protein
MKKSKTFLLATMFSSAVFVTWVAAQQPAQAEAAGPPPPPTCPPICIAGPPTIRAGDQPKTDKTAQPSPSTTTEGSAGAGIGSLGNPEK